MKKILSFFAALLFTISSFSQNGGQANQNSVLEIQYIAFANGNHIFRVYNKQNCPVSAIGKVGNNPDTSFIIPPLSWDTLYVPGTISSYVKVKAKSTNFCNNMPDMGWVETDTRQLIFLPIKFKSINAVRIDKSTIRVVFESEEDNTILYYNITISFDGKTFKTYKVIFPNGIQGSKKYQVDIKNN